MFIISSSSLIIFVFLINQTTTTTTTMLMIDSLSSSSTTTKMTENILFDCLQFTPSTIKYCGHSLPLNHWIIHKTDDLIDVMSVDPSNLLEYVLFIDKNKGKFLLNWSDYQNISEFCLHFDYIYSSHCKFDNFKCLLNASFTSIDQNNIQPNITLNYIDPNGWQQMYIQFNLIDQPKSFFLHKPILAINGQIFQQQKETTKESLKLNMDAYIAIKMIEILQGQCPKRIGTRSMLIFMLIMIFLKTIFIQIYSWFLDQYNDHIHHYNIITIYLFDCGKYF